MIITLLKNFERFSLYILLAFLIAIPGSFLVPVKAALFMSYFLISALLLFQRNVKFSDFFSFSFWFTFLIIYLILGILLNEPSIALREFAAYITILFFLQFVYIFLRTNLVETSLTKIFILSITFYFAIKSLLLYVTISGLISPFQIVNLVESYAPGMIVTSLKYAVPRITTANDYILPFLLFWLLLDMHHKKNNAKLHVLGIVVCIILIVISLSRYLYIVSIIFIVLYFFLFFNVSKVKYVLLLLITFCAAFFIMKLLDYDTLIFDRFFGLSMASSNFAKFSQTESLINNLGINVLFGNGFGAKMLVPGRNFIIHNEVQWIGLLYKIGIIGISIILLYILYISSKLLSFRLSKINKYRICVFSSFFLWMLGGFFNPVLLLTTTSVNYILLMLMYNKFILLK